MDEKELDFNRKKHICYSKVIKRIIQNHIRIRFSELDREDVWEKVQLQYVEFLKDLPYLGGKSCRHNGPGGTYDCIALFAFYEVLEDKPSIKELFDMNNEAFLPPFARLGKIFNCNHLPLQAIMHKIFKVTAKTDAKLEKECPTSYKMEVQPYVKGEGIHYQFKRCPIAEFAKAHGYLDIMPAFCNGDYPAMELIHAGLIREHTCSNSDHCDYWIVGDKSSKLIEYPMIKDEKGYFKNKIDKDLITEEDHQAN